MGSLSAWLLALAVLGAVLAPSGHVRTAARETAVRLRPAAGGLTSPTGAYRWLDVADRPYGAAFCRRFRYRDVDVRVRCRARGSRFAGRLTARGLKPDFAYQLKLVGTPGTATNERLGLAGRWWEETWANGAWTAGANLNDKGDGMAPSPNDRMYLLHRDAPGDGPGGRRYRHTGYLAFAIFVTDARGRADVPFAAADSFHVFWKTSQRPPAVGDGPVTTRAVGPDPAQTVGLYGEWERLPAGGVRLPPGDYRCRLVLTEESFHGTAPLAGAWAAALAAPVRFRITAPEAGGSVPPASTGPAAAR